VVAELEQAIRALRQAIGTSKVTGREKARELIKLLFAGKFIGPFTKEVTISGKKITIVYVEIQLSAEQRRALKLYHKNFDSELGLEPLNQIFGGLRLKKGVAYVSFPLNTPAVKKAIDILGSKPKPNSKFAKLLKKEGITY